MRSKDPIPAQASQARRFQLCRLGRALSFLQKPSLKPSQLSGPHRVRGHRFRNQGRGGRARILPENPKKELVSPLGRRLVPGVLRLSWRAPRAPSGQAGGAPLRCAGSGALQAAQRLQAPFSGVRPTARGPPPPPVHPARTALRGSSRTQHPRLSLQPASPRASASRLWPSSVLEK